MGYDFLLLLKEYFKEILSVLGAIGMFFLGKKKRNQNIKSQSVQIIAGELDNVEAALKIYRVMLSDLKNSIAEAQIAYDLLEKRFQVAIIKNNEFREKINSLEKKNIQLTEKLTKCK